MEGSSLLSLEMRNWCSCVSFSSTPRNEQEMVFSSI